MVHYGNLLYVEYHALKIPLRPSESVRVPVLSHISSLNNCLRYTSPWVEFILALLSTLSCAIKKALSQSFPDPWVRNNTSTADKCVLEYRVQSSPYQWPQLRSLPKHSRLLP